MKVTSKLLGSVALSAALAVGMSMPAFAATTQTGSTSVELSITPQTPQINVTAPSRVAATIVNPQLNKEYSYLNDSDETSKSVILPGKICITNNEKSIPIELYRNELKPGKANPNFEKWCCVGGDYPGKGTDGKLSMRLDAINKDDNKKFGTIVDFDFMFRQDATNPNIDFDALHLMECTSYSGWDLVPVEGDNLTAATSPLRVVVSNENFITGSEATLVAPYSIVWYFRIPGYSAE